MKLIIFIFSLIASSSVYSDYIRTGPVEYEDCFLIVCGFKEVDSYEMGGSLYRFQKRYDRREITEVVNNGTMCYSNTVRGPLYFKGKRMGSTNEIRFKCRSVRWIRKPHPFFISKLKVN